MAIFSTSPEWYGSDGTLKNIDTEISKITSGETVAGKAEYSTKADKVLVLEGYASILDAVYPIGSIYMSASSTNPGSLFGGTWEAWGAGRVPVSVDANDKDFNAAGKTGGTKEAELLWHSHESFSGSQGPSLVEAMVGGNSSGVEVHKKGIAGSGEDANGYLITVSALDSRYSANDTAKTSSAGKSNASNLQPYITCYMWKRTA